MDYYDVTVPKQQGLLWTTMMSLPFSSRFDNVSPEPLSGTNRGANTGQ